MASSTCSVRSAASACERQSANKRAGESSEILRRCDSPLRPSSSSSWHRLRRNTQARELKIPGRGTGSSALASARCSGRACGRILPRQPSLLRNQPGCHQALSSETVDASGSAAHHCYPCLSTLCPAEAIRMCRRYAHVPTRGEGRDAPRRGGQPRSRKKPGRKSESRAWLFSRCALSRDQASTRRRKHEPGRHAKTVSCWLGSIDALAMPHLEIILGMPDVVLHHLAHGHAWSQGWLLPSSFWLWLCSRLCHLHSRSRRENVGKRREQRGPRDRHVPPIPVGSVS